MKFRISYYSGRGRKRKKEDKERVREGGGRKKGTEKSCGGNFLISPPTNEALGKITLEAHAVLNYTFFV